MGTSADDRLRNLRVLVVEDEKDIRKMVQFVLEQSGAAVMGAASYAEAVDAYNRAAPNVIIADIGMPDYNGYALIAKIREEDKKLGRETPAIALTAYTSDADRKTALSSGFQDYMAKPFDPDALIDKVAELVKAA